MIGSLKFLCLPLIIEGVLLEVGTRSFKIQSPEALSKNNILKLCIISLHVSKQIHNHSLVGEDTKFREKMMSETQFPLKFKIMGLCLGLVTNFVHSTGD